MVASDPRSGPEKVCVIGSERPLLPWADFGRAAEEVETPVEALGLGPQPAERSARGIPSAITVIQGGTQRRIGDNGLRAGDGFPHPASVRERREPGGDKRWSRISVTALTSSRSKRSGVVLSWGVDARRRPPGLGHGAHAPDERNTGRTP
jgi:hypothetical protein